MCAEAVIYNTSTNTSIGEHMQYPPLSLTLMLAFTCCAVGLVLGLLILGFVVSFQNRKKAEEEKKEKTQ